MESAPRAPGDKDRLINEIREQQLTATLAYGSHMPALRWAVERTEGPIFEMGAGLFSTPYLVSTGRELVTYELDPKWKERIKVLVGESPTHTWTDKAPYRHFPVAFLDGGTDESWLKDRRDMFNIIKADIILVHDLAPHLFSEDTRPWHGAEKRFEYQAWYKPTVGDPATWITSDFPIVGLPESTKDYGW
jgi:hypothetical protein